MGYQKGHWGEYSGNAKWSRDHAHTKVTKENYKASERDDAAHIDYLKRDVLYDDHHGHSDEKMTADEKHISKLAGDMKYDKEKHGSPAKHVMPHSHKGDPMSQEKKLQTQIHQPTQQIERLYEMAEMPQRAKKVLKVLKPKENN
jgi:hypothetical protein